MIDKSNWGSPFDMVTRVIRASLQFDRRWTVESTIAKNPVTSLRGVLGAAIQSSAMLQELDSWIRKPSSVIYPDQLPPQVIFQVETVPEEVGWGVRIVIRGAHRESVVTLLQEAIELAGRLGISHQGELRPFKLTGWTPSEAMSLGNFIVGSISQHPPAFSGVVLTFATPCSAPSFQPGDLAGNLACNLVKIDHAFGSFSKDEVDKLADEARRRAKLAFNDTRVTSKHLYDSRKGHRRSGETGEMIPLSGKIGFLMIENNLLSALPWLEMLALHGAGGNTAFGAGSTKLSFLTESSDHAS